MKSARRVLELWYLARLRKAALEEAQIEEMTPAGLIVADSELVEKLVTESSRYQSGSPASSQQELSHLSDLVLLVSPVICFLVWLYCYELGSFPAWLVALASLLLFFPLRDLPGYFSFLISICCYLFLPLALLDWWLNKKHERGRGGKPERPTRFFDKFSALLFLAILLESVLAASIACLAGSSGCSESGLSGLRAGISSCFLFGAVSTVALYLVVRRRLISPLVNAMASLSRRLGGQFELPFAEQYPEPDSAAQMISFLGERLMQLRESQRAIVQYSPEIICFLDEKGLIQALSGSLRQITGHRPTAILGRSLQNFLAPDYVEVFESSLAGARNEGVPKEVDVRLCMIDGGLCDLSITSEWSTHEQGYFLVASDVTATKDLERSRREFVSMVSYDLRAPLTSLKSNLELVAMGRLGEISPELKQSLAKGQREINQIIALINKLLDREKSASGDLKLNLRWESLSDILDAAAQSLSDFAARRGIKLLVLHTKAIVWAEAEKLTWVVSTLISNAIEVSPADQTVEIAAKDLGRQVEVQVIDRGKGIPRAYQSEIFERCGEMSQSDSPEKRGMATVLSISKALIAAHGGEIGVYGDAGAGSTFWFRVRKVSQDELEGAPDKLVIQ